MTTVLRQAHQDDGALSERLALVIMATEHTTRVDMSTTRPTISAAMVAAIAKYATERLRWDDTATAYIAADGSEWADSAYDLTGAGDEDSEVFEHSSVPVGTWRITVRGERDSTSLVDDWGEGLGRVEWVRRDHRWSPSRVPRPRGFDGAACIIEQDCDGALWWQPDRDESGQVHNTPADRRIIERVVEEGFHGIVVIAEQLDAFTAHLTGNRTRCYVERDSASLWGLFPVDYANREEVDYRREVIDQLLSDVTTVVAEESPAGE